MAFNLLAISVCKHNVNKTRDSLHGCLRLSLSLAHVSLALGPPQTAQLERARTTLRNPVTLRDARPPARIDTPESTLGLPPESTSVDLSPCLTGPASKQTGNTRTGSVGRTAPESRLKNQSRRGREGSRTRPGPPGTFTLCRAPPFTAGHESLDTHARGPQRERAARPLRLVVAVMGHQERGSGHAGGPRRNFTAAAEEFPPHSARATRRGRRRRETVETRGELACIAY